MGCDSSCNTNRAASIFEYKSPKSDSMVTINVSKYTFRMYGNRSSPLTLSLESEFKSKSTIVRSTRHQSLEDKFADGNI